MTHGGSAPVLVTQSDVVAAEPLTMGGGQFSFLSQLVVTTLGVLCGETLFGSVRKFWEDKHRYLALIA